MFSAVGAGMQQHSLEKIFWEKLIRLGKILLDLGKIWTKIGKIWKNLIRCGQNQNLASPKTFDLLRL